MPVLVFSQGYTGDYFKARNYVQAPMFRTATDTIYRNGGLEIDSLKINGSEWLKSVTLSQWTTSGSDIYYNTGNVFIGKTSGTYNLDVNGLIGGSNIETNLTSQSTRLGHQSGNSENETDARYNTFVGYNSGYTNSTGIQNLFSGYNSGYSNATGFYNVYLGSYSGYSTTGNRNTFIGVNSGRTITSGYNNTFIGYSAGNGTEQTSYSNIFLGYMAGKYETGNNKLFIDNQDRTSEALSRSNALIYGQFNTTVTDQRVTANALFDAHNIETNITSGSTRLGFQSGLNENESAARRNVFVGYLSGNKTTTGTDNTYLGNNSGYTSTTGTYNTFLGGEAGYSTTNGVGLSVVGFQSGYNNTSGQYNTFMGYRASFSNKTGSSNVTIGYNAKYYSTNMSNELVIDNQQRGTTIADSLLYRTSSLLYGTFDATPANQTLTANAKLYYIGTFAEIHVHDASAAQTIPTGTTYTKLTCYTDNGESSNCTPDAANDKITITKTGRYRVTANSSTTVSAAATFRFAAFLGGVEQDDIHSMRKFPNNDISGGIAQGFINVTSVPVDLDMRCSHDQGGNVDVTIVYSNLNVEYIGE